jgi:hypothetical protein
LFLRKNLPPTSPRIYYTVQEDAYGKFNLVYDNRSKKKIVVRDSYAHPLKISRNTQDRLFENNQTIELEDFIKLIEQ